ncbi:MAG TPA: hypothetical protein ENK18_23615 [Deltaproteobacteria bacterium]|nr:hypothetical protein [Deltaproteobacteria bacterium]
MRPVPMDVSGHTSLGSLLDEALLRHLSRTALIEANRRREASRWSFAEVDRVAGQVAARLWASGIRPGDRIAILMSNQPRWLVTAVAVFRCGAVLVPLDFKLTPPEQLALLQHASPAALMIEHGLFRLLPTPPEVPRVWVSEAPEGVDLGGAERWDALPEGTLQPQPRQRDDLATIVYSSGTGGRAKGCMLSHGAYLTQLQGLLERFPMVPGDRYLSVLPTNHAIDFMVGFVGPFCCGATVVHQRTLRPELLRWTLRRYRITHMAVVPMLLSAFQRALDEAREAATPWRRDALSLLTSLNARLTSRQPRPELSRLLLKPVHDRFGGRLRLLFCGGAFTERALAEGFYRLGLPVVIGYGLSEACTVVTVNGLSPFRADSVGSPLSGTELRIDAPDRDGVGEVLVRGPTLMDGYLDDPELTAEVLRDGWLYTGDLGWIDASGHLHLVGRRKDVIVTAGGKNVYPEDVEHAFVGVGAEEIAVFAANTLWPQRSMVDEELVVVIRPSQLDAGGLAEALVQEVGAHNRSLPGHKRICGLLPWGDPFPRTASMKLKRRELARQIAQRLDRGAVIRLSPG